MSSPSSDAAPPRRAVGSAGSSSTPFTSTRFGSTVDRRACVTRTHSSPRWPVRSRSTPTIRASISPGWPRRTGLASLRNHPYRDGNKRIAFLALVTFLGINGREFEATEEDVVATILTLAEGRVTEEQLARWIRDRLVLLALRAPSVRSATPRRWARSPLSTPPCVSFHYKSARLHSSIVSSDAGRGGELGADRDSTHAQPPTGDAPGPREPEADLPEGHTSCSRALTPAQLERCHHTDPGGAYLSCRARVLSAS